VDVGDDMPLLPATLEISYDELAYSLSELIQPSPLGAPRRFQIILVIRDNDLAEYRIDLGPSSNFTAPEFRIPGGIVDEITGRGEILHTVGELKDIAIEMRERGVPTLPRRDIWQEFYDQQEEKEKSAIGYTIFGPGGSTVRG
jgi:hypothetical protein